MKRDTLTTLHFEILWICIVILVNCLNPFFYLSLVTSRGSIINSSCPPKDKASFYDKTRLFHEGYRYRFSLPFSIINGFRQNRYKGTYRGLSRDKKNIGPCDSGNAKHLQSSVLPSYLAPTIK